MRGFFTGSNSTLYTITKHNPAASIGTMPKTNPKTTKTKAKTVAAVAVSALKKTHAQRLDEIGIDAICERIRSTEYQDGIAKSLGMSGSTLSEWISADPERSARAHEAREASAFVCEQLAVGAILDISDDATQAAVTRQRELAHHYRWSAKVRNQKKFGDRVELAGDANAPLVVIKDFSGTK